MTQVAGVSMLAQVIRRCACAFCPVPAQGAELLVGMSSNA